MSKTRCAKCSRKKGFFEISIEGWYKCPNCGPICDECHAESDFIGLSDKKCPKCGRTLEGVIEK